MTFVCSISFSNSNNNMGSVVAVPGSELGLGTVMSEDAGVYDTSLCRRLLLSKVTLEGVP